MTSKLKKTIKKIDPLLGGDVILDKIGLPSVFGDDYGFVQDPIDPNTGSVAAAPTAPTAVSADTEAAREAQRRRQLQGAGLGGNILTGSGGISGATTSGKTLLGS